MRESRMNKAYSEASVAGMQAGNHRGENRNGSGARRWRHTLIVMRIQKKMKYPQVGLPVVTGLGQLKHLVFTWAPNILIYDPQILNTYLSPSICHAVPLVEKPVFHILLGATTGQRAHLGSPSVYRAPCILPSESSTNICGVDEPINE